MSGFRSRSGKAHIGRLVGSKHLKQARDTVLQRSQANMKAIGRGQIGFVGDKGLRWWLRGR
jgi:hypothetical protein